MLNLEQRLQIANLLDQTGEPRPGYLHDQADNFEGDGSAHTPGVLQSDENEIPRQGAVMIELAYIIDEQTGDLRIVRKM